MASDAKLWKAFSLYIRLKYSNENGYCTCYTCGAIRYYTDCDCGHGIGRQFKATKFDEKNNRPQCKPCNGFHGGMREKFKEAMDNEHGEGTWDLMIIKSKQRSKLSQWEYDLLEKHYKNEAAALMKEKHLSR